MESLKENNIEDGTNGFTLEELKVIKETFEALKAEGISNPSLREVALVVMNCKLRVETAVKKYKKWIEAMKQFNVESFDDIWGKIPRDGSESEEWKAILPMLTAYAGCGRDTSDRSIMWIKTRPVQVDEEKLAIQTSVMYFTAIHADIKSLRNGVTFVLDTSRNPMDKQVGNEQKLQRFWQSIPLRPQKIFILGAGYIKRVLINAALSLASLFTSEKIIDRIKFTDLEEVKTVVTDDSLPVHAGGQGGGVQTEEELLEWIKNRIANFPAINLDQI